MPKIVVPLTDTRIKALQPKEKRYLVSDGGGLVLEVMTSGAKLWRFRYSLHAKQQPMLSLGAYPAVSLAAARKLRAKYAEVVAAGVSPAGDIQEDRGKVKIANSLREFGAYWLREEFAGKSQAYRNNTARALEKDIYPFLGNKAVSAVTAADVLALCDRIKGRGSPQSALFARNTLKRLYSFAIARQVVASNPAQQLAARYIATPQSRERVLSPDEIGEVLRKIYASDMARPSKLALHLLVITMVRKSELTESEWSEVDFEEGIWRIPAARMKKDREHWVYLSEQALGLFRELRTLSDGSAFIFPMRRGREDKPIHKSTLNVAIRALDMDVQHFVLHDFRRTASTHLHEMGYSSDAIEKALAHGIKGVRGVYNRAEYAAERTKIMQMWADFVDAQIQGGRKVIAGAFGRGAA